MHVFATALKGLKIVTVLLMLFLASQALAVLTLFFSGEAGTALALVTPQFRPNALPSSVSILSWETPLITVALPERSVGGLYKAGALLVVPVRRRGCLALAAARVPKR